MKAYVLQAEPEAWHNVSDGYFTGDTFQYQGEIYAVVESAVDLAKYISPRSVHRMQQIH